MRTKIPALSVLRFAPAFFFFVLLPGVIMAEEARVIALSGLVEVRKTREGQWASASKNMEILESWGLRTGADGSAVVLMPNKTKVWLKESTGLEIEQRQTLTSRLALVLGKIKLRVPHLMRREKFEVRTPAAVCAVRGTEFTLETTESGKMAMNVLYGEVKLNFIVPPAKGAAELYIPQGQSMKLEEKGKAGKVALMDPKQERAALENWNPGLKPEERQKELKARENDRAQIKEFARVTNNSESSVKDFLNTAKESDLEAGRTLRDIHGNLVRVDQRMMRPAANEIQFFNLVKRSVYTNDTTVSLGRGGFAYNGAADVANRLDYMQMTMAFNNDLPQSIEEWPSFFNDNSVNPSWASFVLANRTDAQEIFFIAEGYKYDAARDELVSNPSVVGIPTAQTSSDDRNVIITGVLKDEAVVTAMDGLNRISRLQMADAGAGDGTLKYTDAGGNPTTAVNGAAGTDMVWAIKTSDAHNYEAKETGDNVSLWQYQADMYLVGNKTSPTADDYLWYARENYGIGNSGALKNANDFTNSSLDPFSILKDSALESVMYIKQSNSNNPAAITSSALAKAAISSTDYFTYKGAGANIDIVFIPDLMVAAVQRMLPAITNLKD